MEIYTLVSLIIGIFGGSYAALNAMRTNFEGSIKEAAANVDSRLEAIKSVRGNDNLANQHCDRHRKKIRSAWLIWIWANAIPAIIFFTAMIGIALAAITQWDQITIQHTDPASLAAVRTRFPWCSACTILSAFLALNILCVGAAIWAWLRSRNANSRLQEHIDSIKKKAPSGLVPPQEQPPQQGDV